jgi:UrcA family protein
MSFTIKFALAVLAIAATAAPAALAEAGKSHVSFRVAYGDLDMATPMGGQTLLDRIEGAARKICDEADHNAKPDENGTYKCRRRTVESAVRAMNKPMLSLAWSGKGETTSFASR